MRRFTFLGTAVILSTVIVTPVLAETVFQKLGVQEPGGSRGTADAMASVSPPPPSKIGSETTTRPWSAPVGHRQPRVDEVRATPLTQEALDQENANVDRKINNICRGC
jgi:hypothetical protein